ncbi:MAG: glyoxylate/hydroxypyruvate reductase [Burkholderiales bacterium]
MIRILFHMDGEDSAPWVSDLAAHLPHARIRVWQEEDRYPADYAVVWKPPRELLQQRAGLKAVFNLGAGVDAILGLLEQHPDLLPPHVPLIRIEDAGMGAKMTRYVNHAVERHFCRMDDYARQQQSGIWQPLPEGIEANHHIGVLGLGALGAQVAANLAAAGFPIRGWSRSPKQVDGVECYHGEQALDRFLSGLNVVVNLLPLTAETENILDRRLFAKLARGAQLINVARGAHLVEEDLLTALADGQLANATLDVFREEPLPADHPFWRVPRITITPHISAMTQRAESIQQIADKINSLERGAPVTGVVDRVRGY